MIKIKQLDKYFNKGSNREIHVINNTTLDFDKRGLVVLLGKSGSGKTTLLNVLGGLDKVRSGTIEFGDETMKGYDQSKWDRIRNEKIGYIFQNYNLLNDISVFENIALTLRMAGIVDAEEIKTRVEYVLERVGMFNYRYRKAAQLSGGQQQRVAIARALAKNPEVLIADEPTGNLDSKNSIEVMNIIKSISMEKLVILVTHEQDLASMYADRIIKIQDGAVISDEGNIASTRYKFKHDSDIYLKDLNEVANIKEANNSIQVLSDTDEQVNFNVRLIVKNNSVYIDLGDTEFKMINVLDDKSDVKILDQSFIEEEDQEEEELIDFSLDEHCNDELKGVKKTVFNFKDGFNLTMNRLRGLNRVGKIFYFSFIPVAFLIAIALSLLFNVFVFTNNQMFENSWYADEYYPINQIVIDPQTNDNKYIDVDALENQDFFIRYDYYNQVSFFLTTKSIYQLNNNSISITNFTKLQNELNADDLIYGRAIENDNEFVATEYQLQRILNNNKSTINLTGIYDVKDFIDAEYTIFTNGETVVARLVGITNEDDVGIYVSDNLLPSLHKFKNDLVENYDLTFIGDSLDEFGAFVPESYNLEVGEYLRIYGEEIKVIGVYEGNITVSSILFREQDLTKLLLWESRLQVVTSDVNAAVGYISGLGSDTEDMSDDHVIFYTVDLFKKQYMDQNTESLMGIIVFAGVFIVASMLSYFFILRSSLMSRIKEVSVYRALGASSFDVIKLFLYEVLIITTMTSLIGLLLGYLLLYNIEIRMLEEINVIHVSLLNIGIGVAILYFINILSGILPVSLLLRKTPAEILSKYDI